MTVIAVDPEGVYPQPAMDFEEEHRPSECDSRTQLNARTPTHSRRSMRARRHSEGSGYQGRWDICRTPSPRPWLGEGAIASSVRRATKLANRRGRRPHAITTASTRRSHLVWPGMLGATPRYRWQPTPYSCKARSCSFTVGGVSSKGLRDIEPRTTHIAGRCGAGG